MTDVISTIGPGTVVRGSVRGDGDLDVHGRVEGSISIGGELMLGEGSLIKSDVSARRVTVRGAVAGNISAKEAIVLEPGARVVGDLGAPRVGIRPGALVRGHVSTAGPLDLEARANAARAAAARSAAAPAAAARGATPTRTPVVQAPAARPAARPAVAAPVARPAPTPVRPVAVAPAPIRAEGPRVEPAVRADIPAPPPSDPSLEAEDGVDEEIADESDESGGPPAPVVPALRKGAKAQVRRKGAR